jgi:hypothetical protein
VADEKKTEKKTETKAETKKACTIKGCKRPYRAKGYCTTHYLKWRKGEMPKARYKTCNHGVKKLKNGEKKECLKKVFQAGLCEEHFKAAMGKAAEAPAAAPAAAAPAAQA